MPRRPITTRALLILSCIGATAGSLASAPLSAAKATRPLTTRSDPGALVGTWKRVLTRADVDRTASFREEPAGWEAPLVGPQTLVIANGSFTFIDKTGFAIAQTTRVDSGGAFDVQAYVAPDKGAFCPQWIPQNASYTWALDGSDLVLTPTADRCADRDSILTGRWTPAPKTRTLIARRTSTKDGKTGFGWNERLTEGGKSVGTDVGSCTFLGKAKKRADCRVTLRLTDGTLVLRGKVDLSKRFRLTIATGTGAYAGAGGWGLAKIMSSNKTLITLHFA
jgi:hypothetical protein